MLSFDCCLIPLLKASEIKTTLDTKLAKLQELLFVSGKHAVLMVLQGVDSSGKDGAISVMIYIGIFYFFILFFIFFRKWWTALNSCELRI